MQTKQLVFLLLLVQLSCVLTTCPKGYYGINNPRDPCSLCYFGQYCPGDDLSYDCPTGYAAPNQGMSACIKCQSNRSNADATVCLLVDTPPQAQESLDDPNDDTLDLYKIDKKASNWFTTVLVGDLYRSLPIQYGFNCANRKENVPLTVFASVKTGAPNKSNYQWMATGLNATLVVTVDWIDPNAEFIVIYFTFIPSMDYTVPFLGTTFKGFVGEITAAPNQLVVREFLDFSDPINQVVVEWNNIPSMSKVNVSITFEDLTHENDKYLTYSLCYSNLPTIAYPNTFNSNLVVSNKVNSQTTRTLDKVSGPSLRIGVIGGQISDTRIPTKTIAVSDNKNVKPIKSTIISDKPSRKHRNIEQRENDVKRCLRTNLTAVAKRKKIHASTLSRDTRTFLENNQYIPEKKRGHKSPSLDKSEIQQLKGQWFLENDRKQKNLGPFIEEKTGKKLKKTTISLYFNKYFSSEEEKLKRILKHISEKKEFNFSMNTKSIHFGKAQLMSSMDSAKKFNNFNLDALARRFTNDCEHIIFEGTLEKQAKVSNQELEKLRQKKPSAKFAIIPFSRSDHCNLHPFPCST